MRMGTRAPAAEGALLFVDDHPDLDDPVYGHYCADCGVALWKRQAFRRTAFDGYVLVCHRCFMTNPFDPSEQTREAWED